MTREECSKIICQKMLELLEEYKKFHPGGRFMSMTYIDDERGQMILVNNRFFSEDKEKAIDFVAQKENEEWNYVDLEAEE